MVTEHAAQDQAQAGEVVRLRLPVGGQGQQGAAGRGTAAFLASAVAEQPARALFRIDPVARCRVDGEAVAILGQIETRAQRFQQVAFEAAQGPGQESPPPSRKRVCA